MSRNSCGRCGGTRIFKVSAKCSDSCSASLGVYEHNGYVPEGFNIGSGDYVELEACLDCGHLQGEWPVPLGKAEELKGE